MQKLFVIFLSIWLFSEGYSQQIDHPFLNSHFIKINHLNIHYRVWNTNDSTPKGKVLFVHGFCGSTFSWRKNIDTLIKSGYMVYAVDLPPFGYSDRHPRVNHSPSFQAELLWNWVQEIEKDSMPWHLIGHSLGGAIVGAMAARKPEKTAGLVFLDGLFISTKNEGKKWRKRLFGSNKIQSYVEALGKIYFFRYKPFRRILADAYGQKPDSEAVEGYLTPLKTKETASGILDMIAFAEPVFSFTETDIKTIPLIIWGEKDNWIPLQRGKNLQKLFKGSELKIIQGGGHCSNETHPEVFNELILKYLNNFRPF